MRAKTWLVGMVAIALVSCTAEAQDTKEPSPQPSIITGGDSSAQGRFKIRLTLAAPGDLVVKEGDLVIAGQIIADRVKDRTRLTFERDALTREITSLRERLRMPTPQVKALPRADFSEESSAIEHARQTAFEAVRQRENQQRKLDVLDNLDKTDLPEAVIPHEQLLLEEYQRAENQAQAAVAAAVGRLAKSKEARSREEYTHSLEMSKRAIAIRDSEIKMQSAIADLEARLSQTDIALSQLSAVRTPYAGRIQRIKFVGQSNTELAVELYIVVSSQRPGEAIAPSPGSSPGSSPSPQ